jgi:hypothetical protein
LFPQKWPYVKKSKFDFSHMVAEEAEAEVAAVEGGWRRR